jgi:hypothetical protein
MEMDKPHFLAEAAETGFFTFKEQVPFIFENRTSAVKLSMKAY